MESLKEIARLIKTYQSAVIFTHMRPDGDTIGSGMALSRALSLLGIKNEVLNEGEIPERFDYLDIKKEVRRYPTLDADCYIAVDSSDEARLGSLGDFFLTGARKKATFNIDHHVSNKRYAKYNFVRERASNCENIAELIEELGVSFTKEIADFLMTGMVTDSGGFTHSDVNGDSFRAAGKAADAGADVNLVYYETMKKQTRKRAEFAVNVYSHIRYLLDDQLTVAIVPAELLASYGLKPDSTEGIVDFGLSVDSTQVSVCLLEVKKGQYKVSLRSKGRVNVNEIAGVFGGGGHILASGCMLFGELEEVVDKIKYAVWQRL